MLYNCTNNRNYLLALTILRTKVLIERVNLEVTLGAEDNLKLSVTNIQQESKLIDLLSESGARDLLESASLIISNFTNVLSSSSRRTSLTLT